MKGLLTGGISSTNTVTLMNDNAYVIKRDAEMCRRLRDPKGTTMSISLLDAVFSRQLKKYSKTDFKKASRLSN